MAVAAVFICLPWFFPSAYYYRIGALVFIFALAVAGLNLLMGFAGQVSLGHAGFLGIGAYSVAIGPAHFGVPSWLCLFAGAALSAAVAFIVGRPILRLKGHYLAVATLGFGLLVAIILTNEAGLTGGPDGMTVPRLTLLGWSVRGSDVWYWIAGTTFLGGFVLALNLMESPTGRALQAIHDSEVAALMLGVDVARTRWLLLLGTAVLTGAMVSVSGAIGFVGLVLPNAVRLLVGFGHRRVLPLAALLGAVFMVWVDTLARTAFEPREIPVGIITVLLGAPVFVLVLLRHRGRA